MSDGIHNPLPDERFVDTSQPAWTRRAMKLGVVAVFLGALVAFAGHQLAHSHSYTTEANMNVRKMFDGSVTYWYQHGQFPVTTPAHPMHPAPHRRHKVTTDGWDRIATWRALEFSIDWPHYFQYQYNSNGSGDSATFTASAFADLDGDGVRSTFVRFGAVVDGDVQGVGGLFVANELE